MAEDIRYAERVVILDGAGNIVGSFGGGSGGGAVTITGQALTDLDNIAAAAQSTNPVAVVLDATGKGQQNAAGSLSVVLSSDGPFATVVGAPGDAPATSDTVSATLMAVLRRGLARWTNLFTLLPASLGAKAAALSFPVALATDVGLPAGEMHLGEVGGNSAVAVTTLTRQANTTAYASGQAVQSSPAAALTLACARKTAGTGRIPRVRLSKTGTSTANASFRIHLFKNTPTTLPADAATFTPSGAADFIGSFDVTMDKTFTDGAKGLGVPNVGPYVTFDCAAGSQNLYALIEARAAYTPVSGEVFTLAVEADRD